MDTIRNALLQSRTCVQTLHTLFLNWHIVPD